MATTTAKLTMTSTDLIDSQDLGITATMTMKQAASANGLNNTTGLARKTLATGHAAYDVVLDADYTAAKNHRLYLRCVGTAIAEYIEIKVEGVTLGRLYSGDWCLLPYSGTANTDVTADPSADGMTLEYMFFYED
jgi:hypothetical protein